MNRRSTLLIGIFSALLFLSACSGKTTVSIEMNMSTTDATKTVSLVNAVERVLTRKFAASNIKGVTISVIPTSMNTSTLTMTFAEEESAEEAKRIISDPFTFDIRLEKEGAKSEDVSEWEPTGIDAKHVEWVQAIGNRETGEIGVELQLTEEGKNLLQNTFRGRKGRSIGIFVKDILISKLKITSETLEDRVVISGVPSAKIAEIFADDVNVGLHVSFVLPPVPAS